MMEDGVDPRNEVTNNDDMVTTKTVFSVFIDENTRKLTQFQ